MFDRYLYEIRFVPEGYEPPTPPDIHDSPFLEGPLAPRVPGEVIRRIVLQTPIGSIPNQRIHRCIAQIKDATVQLLGRIDPQKEPMFFAFLEANMPLKEAILEIYGDMT